MNQRTFAIVALLPLLLLGAMGRATDFYVSSSGNNGLDGKSPAEAWQTIARLHMQGLHFGDTVNFQGVIPGGPFWVMSSGVTVQSYGGGTATIESETHGIVVYNAGDATIRNLILIGSSGLYTSGVRLLADTGSVRWPNVVLEDIDASYFGDGIEVWGYGGAGFDGVRMTRVAGHHNVLIGIVTHADNIGDIQNVLIQDSWAGWNDGTPEFPDSSGNGIALGQVDGGIIERSVALYNGIACTGNAGGAGLWAWESNNIIIRLSESHHNQTGGPVDGDGFDLDWGVTNSIVEDSYSHDNEGAGFLAVQLPNVRRQSGNNVFRRNRSVNDGLKNGFGSLMTYGEVGNVTFEHNEVEGSLVVNEQTPTNAYLTFRCNTYIGPFRAWWDNTIYNDLASLRAATGTEAGCDDMPVLAIPLMQP